MKRRIIQSLSAAILTVLISFINTEAIESVDLPEEVQQICIEAGEEFDINPTMLMAIIWQESRGLLDNLTQITYIGWFEEGIEYTGNDDIKDRKNNVRICAYYMRKWADEYNDIEISLTGWNQGIENSLVKDGRSYYATTVIEKSKEFERKWGYGWKRNH